MFIPGTDKKNSKNNWRPKGDSDLPPRWTDGLSQMMIADSNPARNKDNRKGRAVWHNLRLIGRDYQVFVHWLTSKNGKNFPMLCPDWDIENGKWDHSRGCPIHRKGPFQRTYTTEAGETKEVVIKQNAAKSAVFNVIDRQAQEAGEPDYVRIVDVSGSVVGKISDEMDAVGALDPSCPFEGHDIRIKRDTRETGTGIWSVRFGDRTPLTTEEIETVYGLYRLVIPVADLKRIKKEEPGIEKRLRRLGAKKTSKGWKLTLTGLEITELCEVESHLEGEPGPGGRIRVNRITIGGVEVHPEELQAPMAVDIPAAFFPAKPEDIEKALKVNGYLDDDEPDEEDDEKPSKRKSKKSKSSKSKSKPKAKKQSRFDDDEDDDDLDDESDDFDDEEDDDDFDPPPRKAPSRSGKSNKGKKASGKSSAKPIRPSKKTSGSKSSKSKASKSKSTRPSKIGSALKDRLRKR